MTFGQAPYTHSCACKNPKFPGPNQRCNPDMVDHYFFAALCAIPWVVLLLLSIIYMVKRAKSIKKKSNSAEFDVPNTDGHKALYEQMGFVRSTFGVAILVCWILYVVLLWVGLLFITLANYNWFCLFGWTFDAWDENGAAFIILIIYSWAIIAPLALFKQKISQLVLIPCGLGSATLVMVKKKVVDDDEDDIDPRMQTVANQLSLETLGDSTPGTSSRSPPSQLSKTSNLSKIRTKSKQAAKNIHHGFMHFLHKAESTLEQSLPILKVQQRGVPYDNDYFKSVNYDCDANQQVRIFEFMCLRYVWRKDLKKFVLWEAKKLTPNDCFEKYENGGMTKKQAKAAQQLSGRNKITVPTETFTWSMILEFSRPLYMINFLTIWVWFIYSGWNMAAVWLINIVFSGTMRVVINRRTKKKVQKIAAMNEPVMLYREGKWKEHTSDAVVPGDVIMLQEGKLAPCDAVCTVGNCVMNESMLTGEPMPVLKFQVSKGENTIDKKCMVFGGTEVLQSMGGPDEADNCCIAVASSTAGEMTKGQVVRMVLYPMPLNFIFRKHLNILYFFLVIWALINAIVTIALGDLGYWAWTLVLAFSALSYAVNPSMDVTITWAENLAVDRLEKKQISCLDPSRLVVAAKVHCAVFDKTGTITQETIDLKYVTLSEGGEFHGTCEIGEDHWRKQMCALPDTRILLHVMGLCHAVTKLKDGRVVGNSVEVSMWTVSGWSLPDENGNCTPNRKIENVSEAEKNREIMTEGKVAEIEKINHPEVQDVQILRVLRFDHQRMTSGCIVNMVLDGKKQNVLLVKGSFDKVKVLCRRNTIPNDYDQYVSQAAGNQEYILSAGYKILDNKTDIQTVSRSDLESNLIFAGVLHFSNDLRPTSKNALTQLRDAGIRTCMCTGDSTATAIAVARKVGMLTTTTGDKPDFVVSGAKPKRPPTHDSKHDIDFDHEDEMVPKLTPKVHMKIEDVKNKHINKTTAANKQLKDGHENAIAKLSSKSMSFKDSDAFKKSMSFKDLKSEDDASNRKSNKQLRKELSKKLKDDVVVWNSEMHVIYGELQEQPNSKKKIMVWEHVDTSAKYSTQEVLELAQTCPDHVEIILSGEALLRIDHGPSDDNIPPIAPILPLIRITSRVTPAGKVAFVGAIARERKAIVGMVGDGGNDCGALREAHVGCAMSSAEASLVAPFATSSGSLVSFCHIIMAGRCTLQTNKATTMWFTIMALEVALTHTLQTLVNVSQAEWVVIMVYLVFSIFVSYCIVQGAPEDKLTVPRPSARIFGPLFMSRMFWHLLIYVGLSLAAWLPLKSHDWYYSCDQIRELPKAFAKLPYTARSNDFRSEMYTFIVLWHLITTGFALSFGGIFRKKVYHNFWIIFATLLFCFFVLALLWSGPNGFSCTFSAQCDVPTQLDTEPVVISQLSVGPFGGCFLGAQMCKEYKRLEKNNIVPIMPEPDQFCTYNPTALMPFTKDSGIGARVFTNLGGKKHNKLGWTDGENDNFGMMSSFLEMGSNASYMDYKQYGEAHDYLEHADHFYNEFQNFNLPRKNPSHDFDSISHTNEHFDKFAIHEAHEIPKKLTKHFDIHSLRKNSREHRYLRSFWNNLVKDEQPDVNQVEDVEELMSKDEMETEFENILSESKAHVVPLKKRLDIELLNLKKSKRNRKNMKRDDVLSSDDAIGGVLTPVLGNIGKNSKNQDRAQVIEESSTRSVTNAPFKITNTQKHTPHPRRVFDVDEALQNVDDMEILTRGNDGKLKKPDRKKVSENHENHDNVAHIEKKKPDVISDKVYEHHDNVAHTPKSHSGNNNLNKGTIPDDLMGHISDEDFMNSQPPKKEEQKQPPKKTEEQKQPPKKTKHNSKNDKIDRDRQVIDVDKFVDGDENDVDENSVTKTKKVPKKKPVPVRDENFGGDTVDPMEEDLSNINRKVPKSSEKNNNDDTPRSSIIGKSKNNDNTNNIKPTNTPPDTTQNKPPTYEKDPDPEIDLDRTQPHIGNNDKGGQTSDDNNHANQILGDPTKDGDEKTKNKTPVTSTTPKKKTGKGAFEAWRGKYFAQFSLLQSDWRVYFQIDEYGVNMLSGFKDQTLMFTKLGPSTDSSHSASDGWMQFTSPDPKFPEWKVSTYIKLQNGNNTPGDLDVFTVAMNSKTNSNYTGGGVATKFKKIFFSNLPAFETGSWWGSKWCHGLNNCMDKEYKTLLTILLVVFAVVACLGQFVIDRLASKWNKNKTYFPRV